MSTQRARDPKNKATQWLLALWVGGFVLMELSGCSKQPGDVAPASVQGLLRADAKSVNDYLHDIDNARRVADEAKGLNTGPDSVNASAALNIATFQRLNKCWKVDGNKTSANTDHACLDKFGYVRGKK